MQSDTRTATGGAAALGGAALLFSWGFVLVKSIGLPAATIGFWRLVIGSAVLVAWLLVVRGARASESARSSSNFGAKPSSRPTPWLAVLGAGLFFGAHQWLYIEAASHTAIAHVTLIGAMQALVVPLVAGRAVGERASKSFLGWALLAVVGVALVVRANLGDASRSLYGDLLSVVNLFAFVGYFLFAKRARQAGVHPVTLTAAAALVAAVTVAPALVAVEVARPVEAWQWGLVALLALGPGNGHVLVNWAHARVTAAFASLVLTAVPLLASLWAHLVLGEPFGAWHVAGAVLVAVAIEGARRAEGRAARDRQ